MASWRRNGMRLNESGNEKRESYGWLCGG